MQPTSPTLEERPRPEHEDAGRTVSVRAEDGLTLSGRFFEARAGFASLVISGAMATRQGFYRRLASWLAERGIHVLSYDPRGIGASRAPGSTAASHTLVDWARRDHPAAVDALAALTPDLPRFALGHGLGGQLLGLSPSVPQMAGLIFVASGSDWVGHWRPRSRTRMQALSLAAIFASRGFGYLPGWLGLGEDLPPDVVSQWTRWSRLPGYVTEAEPDAKAGFASLSMPRRVYSFSGDPLAPAASVEALCRWMPEARMERLRVTSGRLGHHGFFRPEGRRHWPGLRAWLEVHARRVARTAQGQHPELG